MEANIYHADLDSFLVIVVLNFNGLNSTSSRPAPPQSAPQVLPIFAGRGKTCFFRDVAGQSFFLWGGVHIPDTYTHTHTHTHAPSVQLNFYQSVNLAAIFHVPSGDWRLGSPQSPWYTYQFEPLAKQIEAILSNIKGRCI